MWIKKNRRYCLWASTSMLLVILGCPLEIFDFAPLLNRTFDGHSLWHFFGNGIAFSFSMFIVKDFEWHVENIDGVIKREM